MPSLNIGPPGAGDPLATLDRVAWEGGSDYWSQFTVADAAGWSDPSFFPIAVWFPDPAHASQYVSMGVNTCMGLNHTPPVSTVTDAGMFVIAQSSLNQTGEWSPAEIGSNGSVVGWFVYDECEQGEGACSAGDEFTRLAQFQGWCDTLAAQNDGRYLFANFGNGVLRTFWAVNTMADFVQSVDAACIDKYAYTSPGVREAMNVSSDWPLGSGQGSSPLYDHYRRAASYGWFVDQVRNHFDDPADRRPSWVFIETKKPYLGEDPAEIILYDEIRGAVWSALVHEARGIAYFTHNGLYPPNVPAIDPNTGVAPDTDSYSLIDCEPAIQTYVGALNAEIAAFAPVLNTQSYVFDFGATGIDTMLKSSGGFAYIFTSVGITGTTGSKTFTLPTGVTGTTVEVVNESRSLGVSGGQFTDSFAQEYSQHVYKVAI